MKARPPEREPKNDYRAKATIGVAVAALSLLLPFVVLSIVQDRLVMAVGTGCIVVMLSSSAWLAARGRSYETPTLFGVVPIGMLIMTHVFQVDGVIGSVWCYPSILGCYCMLSQRKAWASNAIILGVALPMVWTTLPADLAARFTATMMAVSLFAAILVREIDAQQQRLQFQLEHDPLTGLLNRISLRDRLEAAIRERARTQQPAALLALDLDHFKSINDRYGHDMGDLVLCEVARHLRAHVRASDAVFRTGGEEFLVLLNDVDKRSAIARAEGLRSSIETARILQQRPVTASVGIATLREDDDRWVWASRSDARLYHAKENGRNRVVSDGDTSIFKVDSVDAPQPSPRSCLSTPDGGERCRPTDIGRGDPAAHTT